MNNPFMVHTQIFILFCAQLAGVSVMKTSAHAAGWGKLQPK